MPAPLDEATIGSDAVTAGPSEATPQGPSGPSERDAQSHDPPALSDALVDDLAAQVAALALRVDKMAESFETSVRQAVADEVHRVAAELQHTVTALGRILVRDLGKLSQILAEHRDTIVAELRVGPEGARPGPPSIPAGTEGQEVPETGPPEDPPEPGAEASIAGGSDEQKDAPGRQWRSRRRKA